LICSACWNRGLATEAATAVRDYAFRVRGLTRLIRLIRQGNEASRRVAEKVGMRFEGILREENIAYWQFTCSAEETSRT
jgi:[ribosomal protein S5]-alanine N-acetyltransferase